MIGESPLIEDWPLNKSFTGFGLLASYVLAIKSKFNSVCFKDRLSAFVNVILDGIMDC